MKRRLCSHDFSEDVVSFRGPDKGFSCLVVVVDIFVERFDQFKRAPEDASPQPVFGEVTKKPLDHV